MITKRTFYVAVALVTATALPSASYAGYAPASDELIDNPNLTSTFNGSIAVDVEFDVLKSRTIQDAWKGSGIDDTMIEYDCVCNGGGVGSHGSASGAIGSMGGGVMGAGVGAAIGGSIGGTLSGGSPNGMNAGAGMGGVIGAGVGSAIGNEMMHHGAEQHMKPFQGLGNKAQ